MLYKTFLITEQYVSIANTCMFVNQQNFIYNLYVVLKVFLFATRFSAIIKINYNYIILTSSIIIKETIMFLSHADSIPSEIHLTNHHDQEE